MSVCKLSLFGVLLASATLLSAAADAQSFTIQSGTTSGNQVLANPGDVGIIESGGTIDAITNGVDAVSMDDDAQFLENRAGGLISQSGNLAAGILSNGLDANILNSGSILTIGDASYAIITLKDRAYVDNGGEIESQGPAAAGIVSGADDAVIKNSGSIRSTGIAASGVILDGLDGSFENSGSIETIDATSSGILVNKAGTIITNSGRIISPLLNTSEAIGIGANNVTLNLLAGTAVQGSINVFGNGGAVNIGKGLNTALTFNLFNPVFLDTGGNPFATNGGLLAVVDPTGFAAQDEVLGDLTGAISGAVDDRFAASRVENAGNSVAMNGMLIAAAADIPQGAGTEYWLKAIDGYRHQEAHSPQVGFQNLFGGLMTGVDGNIGFASRAGFFAGTSLGQLETATNSQKIDSGNFFAGVYGSFNAERAFLDLSLAAGVSNFDSDRRVANNLVLGGIEHAKADFDGAFINPAVTLGTNIPAGNTVLTPSIRARYAALFLGNFTETGSAANLAVDGRHVDIFELRGQLAMTHQSFDFMGMTMANTLRVGVDASFSSSQSVDATLLGQTLSFAAGGRDTAVRGFLGLDGQYTLANGWQIITTTELGIGTDRSFNAEGRIGLDIAL